MSQETGSRRGNSCAQLTIKSFRIIIEVSLVERRGVHRVEQLLDSIDEDFDSMWSGLASKFLKRGNILKFQAPERCMRWLQ